MMQLKRAIAFSLCAIALPLHFAGSAHAQAGPPFMTNDPGTPGIANWEINLGSMQTISRGVSAYEAPQIDLNFGHGDRIQLTYQVPSRVQQRPARSKRLEQRISGAQMALSGRGRGWGADVNVPSSRNGRIHARAPDRNWRSRTPA
jgi:hypothetical protein